MAAKSPELTDTEIEWLREAIRLSERCPKVNGSFAVGAVIISVDGEKLADGFSLETGPGVHAEEVAIQKARSAGIDLTGASIYSSLEPCSRRLSGRRPCCEHIIEAKLARVVFALAEPPVFVNCEGEQTLIDNGVMVVHHPELGSLVEEVNRHVLD